MPFDPGNFRNNPFVTANDFQQYRVTNPDQSEIVRQRLYDYQVYATAGTTQLSFFSSPIGQGITSSPGAVVGSAKTKNDTNLEQASMLPSGKAYLIETIEVYFWPGLSNVANTFTQAVPSVFAAANAAAVAGQVNDVSTIVNSGKLRLQLLDKNYVEETPLMSFPPKTFLKIDSAIATTSATAGEVAVINARAAGRPYILEPMIAIAPVLSFNVFIEFPGVIATPSGFNGRIGVVLDGYLMRASQ